ncbi:MAG: response regulator [Undibacterium sp.]|nr:response regulator [Opitutaceae bacterium]
MLKRLGFKPDIVANGLEVIATLHRQPYDVIPMDMQMPELDGYGASERVRREFPPEARPRIIAVTADPLVGDREKCLAAGTDDHLAKPVTVEGLSRILLRHSPTVPA